MTQANTVTLADLSEKVWQAQVVELAQTLSWKTYHTFNSRRSASGFPDLVLVRDRVLFLELKREQGKLSPDQAGWIRALLAADAEVYVIRPRDLNQLGRILTRRTRPEDTVRLAMRTREEAYS